MAINAATGHEECRKRMEYMIAEIAECAEANKKNHPEWGNGYMGGFPHSDKLWSTFKTGNFSTYFGSWAPFYNLHKMYADFVMLGSIAVTNRPNNSSLSSVIGLLTSPLP